MRPEAHGTADCCLDGRSMSDLRDAVEEPRSISYMERVGELVPVLASKHQRIDSKECGACH